MDSGALVQLALGRDRDLDCFASVEQPVSINLGLVVRSKDWLLHRQSLSESAHRPRLELGSQRYKLPV